MNGKTDIHCHLLYGVDDGAPDLNTASAMLDDAAANGVTKIVMTPHFSSRITPELLCRKRAELTAEAEKHGIALLTGTEYNFHDLPLRMPPIRLGNAPALLLDFRNRTLPPDLPQLLDEVLSREITVVIAHPERTFFPTQKRAILQLHEAGFEFQLTAASLAGRLGSGIQDWSFDLLESGAARLIASDAHNAGSRASCMAKAEKVLTGRYGALAAESLFANAELLLAGKMLRDLCCRPLPWYRRWFRF